MNYETGLGIAALFWIYSLITLLIAVNSCQERNLRKVGQRLSWLTRRPKPMDAEDLTRPMWKKVGKFLLLAAISLPFVLLSWLQVLVIVGTILYEKSKDSGAPAAVREFRWKMRNIDMSFDDIVRESLKVTGTPAEQFEEQRAATIAELVAKGLRHP